MQVSSSYSQWLTQYSSSCPLILTLINQCLSCGSSLAEQSSDAAGQSDHTDLVPPEVGIVDKQAMVEDWLNPESEAARDAGADGEFAPQVQQYKPDCACPPPPGPPQQKISKVSHLHIYIYICI